MTATLRHLLFTLAAVGLIVGAVVAQVGDDGASRGLKIEPSKDASSAREAASGGADAEGVAFFESHVRPLFAAHCVKCHGPDKQKGGLRLDSPPAIMRGGTNGAIIQPGKPDASRLIEAVRYHNQDLQMPPKQKLAGRQITKLTQWVSRGAPMPAHDAQTLDEGPYDWEKWRRFWSFQPIRKPAPPRVDNDAWSKHPIDAFLFAKMQAAGLAPNPPADKLTLLRRATFHLWGLPPSLEQIERFMHDDSPDAWEKLIDRLLASPHYGEHWGRRWLDLARYEQGRVDVPGVENIRDDQRYRDYVVAALNKDKPYDRFILEQLAGDLLPVPYKADGMLDEALYFDQITAPALLSIGDWFDECTDPNRLRMDIVDEQINVTSKVFLGLTVACSRCHDHKFDPIPTEDYYALAGVFGSTRIIRQFSEKWQDGRHRLTRPLATPAQVRANESVRGLIENARKALWEQRASLHEAAMKQWQADEATYRKVAEQLGPRRVKTIEAEEFRGFEGLKLIKYGEGDDANEVLALQDFGTQWVRYDLRAETPGEYIIEALYSSNVPTPVDVKLNAKTVIEAALNEDTGGWGLAHQRWQRLGVVELRAGSQTLQLQTKKTKSGQFPRVDRLRYYRAPDDATKPDATTGETPVPSQSVPPQVAKAAAEHGLNAKLLERFLISPDDPYPRPAGIDAFVDDDARASIERLQKVIAELRSSLAEYEHIVAVADQPRPGDMPVHIGGDVYATRDETVPRGAPRLFDHLIRRPTVAADSSGRLAVARWIASPDNPLSARVLVNRLWQGHFGRGIVETVSDFGSRGTPPSHPELLDYLAASFVESGWSMKHVHRLIMTSQAYRMSSGTPVNRQSTIDKQQSIDPDNRLLWRFPRRRLPVEAIYDSMLCTIGKVDRQFETPLKFNESADRMMYVLTSARSPLGLGIEIRKMFAVFDYRETGLPIDQRDESITSTQALWWLNNPIPKHFAGEFAERLLKMNASDLVRLDRAYLLAYCRPPSDAERNVLLDYVNNLVRDGSSREEAWKQVCLAIYSSNEFRYVE